jgi:hypothetical protein
MGKVSCVWRHDRSALVLALTLPESPVAAMQAAVQVGLSEGEKNYEIFMFYSK